MRVNARMFGFIPAPIVYGLASLAPVKRAIRVVLSDLGIPRDVFQFINWPTRYDNREAAKALKGSGIEVPPLESYAARLWDYWERNLDPDLFIDRSLSGKVKDRVVVVTGGSSGIGHATALKLAEAGAKVLIVARDPEKLEATRKRDRRCGRTLLHATRATSPTWTRSKRCRSRSSPSTAASTTWSTTPAARSAAPC